MLILTEKSSVANDFALALNCPKRTGYFSDGKIEIAYCVGHLFKLQDPEFYEARFKSWNEIPCIPKQFCYAINETVSKQAHIVLELLKKHKDDEILIATDADREGEIIARECLKLSGISDFHKIKRFWVSQALTPDVILNGIKSARKLYEYNNLAQNGFARQHADWLVGMNLTRYVSVAANKKLSIGRVKTALLSAIENRCSKIENFKSEKYYEFYASFGAKRFAPECKGIYFEPDDKTKFNNNELSQELKKDIEQKTLVIENKTEKKETHAPQLYNLNALQKDAFKYFNFSADETLKIIQKLYESYKCVSYPRTPSKVMGNENVELVKQIFLDLSKIYPDFYDVLQISDISLSNKRCFNDSKLEAHHAIIPLENIPHSASDNEKKIFSLILNRFKIAFSAPYIYNKQIVILSVNNHKYKITGNQTLEYGWKKFCWSETFRSNECEEQENEQSLENIDWNNLLCTDVETKRLLLVPADTKYANEIYSNFDMETTKYMYPKPADNINETLDFLNNSICEMRKGTNFQLIIIEKETEKFVGCAGLHDLDNEVPELGIWIKRDKFGKKFGQEAIKGIVNWAVKQNKWKKAKYPVDKRNIASRKIPESLNGIIVKEYKEKNMNGIELDEVEYEVSLEKEFA